MNSYINKSIELKRDYLKTLYSNLLELQAPQLFDNISRDDVIFQLFRIDCDVPSFSLGIFYADDILMEYLEIFMGFTQLGVHDIAISTLLDRTLAFTGGDE